MQPWDEVIQTALIGTGKKMPEIGNWPAPLQEPAGKIVQSGHEQEMIYLQLASLLMNYRKAGQQPLKVQDTGNRTSPEETNPVCSPAATQVLKEILALPALSLLQLWLEKAAERSCLLPPQFIPDIFNLAITEKSIRESMMRCCGSRGTWLSGMNAQWQFPVENDPEETWKTGTPDQRKELLIKVRRENPSLALQWLQQSWPEEDAAGKTVFLTILRENLSNADLPFLESLQQEKSKKVKEVLLDLLKSIPGSAIVNSYQTILRDAVTIKKERALLGLSSKTVLHCSISGTLPQAIFDTGIEKISKEKNADDEQYILAQLVSFTPPSFWDEQLGIPRTEILKLFRQHPQQQLYIPALIAAVARFADRNWAPVFLDDPDTAYPELAHLLDADELDRYLIQHYSLNTNSLFETAMNVRKEWSTELALIILGATNNTSFSKNFFLEKLPLIPVAVSPLLDRCCPKEEYLRNSWENNLAYIRTLLDLKARIQEVFQ